MIRQARPADVPAIVTLIGALASYEREPDAVEATAAGLDRALFGDQPAVFALIAEHEGEIAGFALWFLNFSTWLGRHGIYLEDLYVRPEFRSHGYGRELLAELAAIAHARDYGRVEWSVLDWNESAHRFYTSVGATPMEGWTTWRLTGSAVPELAQRHAPNRDADGRV